jgi:pimeloyl-ACP methyl ester carboxylesterase
MTETTAANDTSTVSTRTLSVPGAELTYDVRGDLASATAERPPLFLVGTPMGAEGFVTLAGLFADRPVITYDPRNVGRSRRHDDSVTPTPEDHAADLHAIISEIGGPVDLFGSSGCAINGLALAIAHPEDVRVLVAHEPPAGGAVPDAEHVRAACHAVLDSYRSSGFGLGMAKFIALVSEQGEIGPDYADRPDPDPAAFGMPTEDDGSRSDPLMNNMSTIPVWAPDPEALRAVPCRVVLAVGEESGETLAARAPRAIAAQGGGELVVFPGDHIGFAGGEYAQTGKPEEFAARLREVLEP